MGFLVCICLVCCVPLISGEDGRQHFIFSVRDYIKGNSWFRYIPSELRLNLLHFCYISHRVRY